MSMPIPLALLGPYDLLSLIAGATLFGKLILLVLLAISVTSWAVLFDKARLLAGFRRGHLKFWDQCDAWLEGRLGRQDFSKWCREHADLPLANIVLEVGDQTAVAAIRRAAERVAYAEMEAMERYLILLSTAVTISPFLGLMGTVWGIMNSFWDMSAQHSANLTVVAPGIAEALITTIAGLATAIPALIFFNTLVRKIDLIGNEMERLRTLLEDEHPHRGNGAGGQHLGEARRPDLHDRERIR
ncbi:MAG: MotA/TolQ/ExbB proton channel family protein [bacterium]